MMMRQECFLRNLIFHLGDNLWLKRSMVEREKRRIQLSKKLHNKRASLRNIIKSHEASMEEKLAASEKLQKLPRDSSASRVTNRCAITGRPKRFL